MHFTHRVFFKLAFVVLTICQPLSASSFTVCSYNCGALSDHYDYIRAVCMHKLLQQRYKEEPELMHQLEKIESTALKILFAEDGVAQEEWDRENYDLLFKRITAHPDAQLSPNKKWHDLLEQIVTSYKERPIVIYDEEVRTILNDHIQDLTRGSANGISNDWIDATRRMMASRIFRHELKYDVIALQEADYLDETLFPEQYAVSFANTKHSVNGLAWNKNRFKLLQEFDEISRGHAFAALLHDLTTDKTLLFVSTHLSGCNPFMVENADSTKGDRELQNVLDFVNEIEADITIIGMDSNVTATHPRLNLLKNAGFLLDCEKYLEPTCSNPWQVLDTRIDWIVVKGASISNVPVLGVGLNSPQTNMSDHKPIAAIIQD